MTTTPNIHYVSKPTLERAGKHGTILAACGAVNPQLYTANPRRAECVRCRAAMLPEEKRA